MARRVFVSPGKDASPAWFCEWKAGPTAENLLDLLLDDAYSYLGALERRKGSPEHDGPSVAAAMMFPRREAPVRLSLDLAGFSPEDLAVQLDGRKLRATAKRESQSRAPDGCCARDYREVSREVLLPEDADLEALSCALGADGQLRIQAPRRIQERVVPIRRVEAQNGGEAAAAAAGGEQKGAAGKK